MYLFGEEKITDVSTALLYLALDEIDEELARRRRVQTTQKLENLKTAIREVLLIDCDATIALADDFEFQLNEVVELKSRDVRVRLD